MEIFEQNFNLEKAIEIAKNAHKDQVDKSGEPYINHPLFVMGKMQSEEEKITGVLHDVVEDSDMTFEDLEKLGCSKNVIEALVLVTHPKDFSNTKEDYIRGIQAIIDSKNQIAINVKFSDLTHNSDLSRLTNPTEDDYKRIEKYKISLDMLLPLVSDYLKN